VTDGESLSDILAELNAVKALFFELNPHFDCKQLLTILKFLNIILAVYSWNVQKLKI